MSEQLYRIEKRPAKSGEAFVSVFNGAFPTSVTAYTVDVLVPVPEVRDLGWACGEMVRHPMREYWCDEHNAAYRWSPSRRSFECRLDGCTMWGLAAFGQKEQDSTSWHAVESAAPAPGTLAWAKATVAAGGAVWNEHDELGAIVKYAFPSYHEIRYPEDGYHLWGDRDWLAALPDGTRVVAPVTKDVYTKRCGWLYAYGNTHGSRVIDIGQIDSLGWGLHWEQEKPRDLASQVAELERRVAKLEGKA